MMKAIIKTLPTGVDVRVGYDDDGSSTDEERNLAVEIALVVNAYLQLKGGKDKRKEAAR